MKVSRPKDTLGGGVAPRDVWFKGGQRQHGSRETPSAVEVQEKAGGREADGVCKENRRAQAAFNSAPDTNSKPKKLREESVGGKVGKSWYSMTNKVEQRCMADRRWLKKCGKGGKG